MRRGWEGLPMWDVAVVGAGVGGCYLADRLAGPGVALFEASRRVGGRLRSAPLPGLPRVVADYGAMRFDETEHTVTDLLRHLELWGEVVPFPVGRPENLSRLRGVRMRDGQLHSADAELPYRLRAAERGLAADGLAGLVADRVLPEFADLHAELDSARPGRAANAVAHYRLARRAARWHGRPLHEVPCSALLDGTVSAEAAALMRDGGGYDLGESAGSAAHWLDTMFQQPPRGGLRRLGPGFQQLPLALHRRFAAAGGSTFLGHRLVRLDRGPGTGYRLTFATAPPDAHPGRTVQVLAGSVLLAVPQRAVELLSAGLLPSDRAPFRRGLASQLQVPAVKLFLAYPSAWWRRAGVASGRSTTDQPLRQLWYWATPEADGPAALLAVYADGPARRYWAALAASAGPARLVAHAHDMAVRLHGLDRAPLPTAAGWQDWPVEPYGGAWPVWRPEFDPDAVIPVMRRPLPGEPVFWVNDAWTPRPGSVEGVLQAAERVLQTDLGLAPPTWLRADAVRWDQS